MGRNAKRTVDYFPHYMPGDTMEWIRDQFGNDGYATWFTLLEQLAQSKDHFIKLDKKREKILSNKCDVPVDKLNEILDELADWGKIDPALWSENIIFSEDFRESILDAYSRRKNNPPTKTDLMNEYCTQEPDKCAQKNGQSAHDGGQVSTNKRKEKETKENKGDTPTHEQDLDGLDWLLDLWAEQQPHDPTDQEKQAQSKWAPQLLNSHGREEIEEAVEGMNQMYKFSDQGWTLNEVNKNFSEARGANASSDEESENSEPEPAYMRKVN